MNRYEFSKHSYNDLKQFLDVVDNSCPAINKNIIKWKTLIPLNIEMVHKLKEHTDTNVIDIDNLPVARAEIIETLNENSVSQSTQLQHVEEYFPQIDGTICRDDQFKLDESISVLQELLKQSGSEEQIMQILQLFNQTEISYVFEALKGNSNVIALGNSLANCADGTVQIYCDKILIVQMYQESEIISNLLMSLLKSHPDVVYYSIISYLCVLTEETAISEEFLQYLRNLSEEHKVKMLGIFINQSSQLSGGHLAVIDCLLHNKIDLLLAKRILDLMAQNANILSGNKNFSVLLQNIINKTPETMHSLHGHFKNMINMVQGQYKIKLQRLFTKMFEQNYLGNSFSQTMHF